MTPSEALAAVERLDREATPGEWFEDDCNVLSRVLADARLAAITAKMAGEPYEEAHLHFDAFVATTEQRDQHSDVDAELIATYRTAAPILAARVRELEEEVKHWRTLYSEAVEAGRAVAFEAGEKGGE